MAVAVAHLIRLTLAPVCAPQDGLVKTVLSARQMPLRAVDVHDGQGAATVVLGTGTLKSDDVIHCLKSTHVRLEMPRREDVFMSKAANCCAEHGVLSPEEKTLPVSTGDPCARVLWHQFPPVTRGLQLSIQQLRPWPATTARSHRGAALTSAPTPRSMPQKPKAVKFRGWVVASRC